MQRTTSVPVARGRVSPSSSNTEKSNQAESNTLEASLLHLVDAHHVTALKLREQSEIAKKDAMRNAVRVSELLVDAVNGGVQECFLNEKRIEAEIRALGVTVTRFMKQTDHWHATTRAINTAIKEIGDFENWMKTMEFDCKSISAAICNIQQV